MQIESAPFRWNIRKTQSAFDSGLSCVWCCHGGYGRHSRLHLFLQFIQQNLNQTFKGDPIELSSPKGSIHEPLKALNVLAEQISRLVVEWIVGIGLVKQINQSIDNRIDIQDGPPVLSQNIQTNLSLQINVGVVNVGLALDLGRRVGVVGRDIENKVICGTLPVPSVGGY